MTRKAFWITILIGVLIIFFFVFVANLISVGERLRSVHVYVEYAFYVLAFVIAYVLIINPLRIIFFAPTFSIEALDDEKKSSKIYRNAAKNLLRLENITEDDKVLLRENFNDDILLPKAIKKVFTGTIRKQIDQTIITHSKTVMVTTAISQNGQLDMFAVIFTNLRMIKEIVQICGFRPTYTNLAKLSVNVAVIAMIAEGLEDVDFSEMMPSKVGEAMTDLPMLRTATNSVFQGISNSLLTCRIGIVTRKFLFADNKLLSKREMRLQSYKESFKLMPIVIKEGLIAFPKGIVGFAMRPFKKKKDPLTDLSE